MKEPSLHRRLVIALFGPLIALIGGSALYAYRVALDAATAAYDRSLLDPALALAKFVETGVPGRPLAVPEAVLDALRIDTVDRIHYRVLAADGSTIAGNHALGGPPPFAREAGHVYFDTALAGEPMRAVALMVPAPEGTVTIEVAETLIKRQALVRELLIGTVVPELIVTAAAALLLWFGARRGLAPLESLRAEITARSPSDLRPVAAAEAPEEVRPLVSALNGLLDRLRAALATQEQFIGNAAHQLRTPIAGLLAHAELALRQPVEPALRQLLETVQAETQRTAHLVTQLLTLTRAEPAGAQHADRRTVNLAEVVGQGANSWVHRALARDIDLGFELDSALTSGEPLLLREMAANLIDNALEYTQPGGRVTVRTGTEHDCSYLQVEDSGPGIPPALRARVTERFYRVPGTPGDGCGLGLAIVRDITLRHGGTLELAGGRDGVGLAATVRLPHAALAGPARAEVVHTAGA